jgi:2-polyprenyl-6-methoxyphenol hydroxylase-like FAD-dependent oxidoreductase
VRERARVTELVWREGRVAGVRYEDAEQGRTRELQAPLVVGADGRRSAVARLAGAERPYRWNANGRACFFAYLEDPHEEWRSVAAQWREGRELGTAFPCDGGLVLVLVMPPVDRVEEFRAGLDDAFRATVDALPGLRKRLAGCAPAGKVRQAVDTTSYFRASAGRGWALPGDAGHFKDPVTAQGIRDALRYGRQLGEAAAPVLDAPRALDRALRRWARRRERECRQAYWWTNWLGRGAGLSPIEAELYRAAAADPELARRFLDVFSRTRSPLGVVTPWLAARLALRTTSRRHAIDRVVAQRP